MKKRLKFVFFFFSVLAFFNWDVYFKAEELSTSSGTVIVNDASNPPQIQLEETLYNFGSVMQGQKVVKKFRFKNVGKGDLVIHQLKSSCGCTAAVASTGPYKAGQTGEIEVNYDSRGKVGNVFKDVKVFTNDPASPQAVAVEGIVIADMHPTKTSGDVLFAGSCAACHAAPAKDKKGEELYQAVCHLCHDFPQENGKKHIAGDKNALAHISKRKLKRIIEKGLPNTSMPGFSYHAGGPLSKDQVDSLVDYILSLKKKQ